MMRLSESNPKVIDAYPKIPAELKALPNWVCFRLEERDGRATKIPYSPSGPRAKANDPATWSSFDACLQAEVWDYDGIGFQFVPPYIGVDLDHCCASGKIEDWAQRVIEQL